MGGAPRIIRKVVSPVKKVVAPSSPIAERREEVAKKTEAEAKQIAHQLFHEENPEIKGHDHEKERAGHHLMIFHNS